LDVGVGGDRHNLSWAAIGVPRRERGWRTNTALAVLPDLIAGKAVDINGTTVQLAPGVAVPPIIVGGMTEIALARAAAHADGRFTLPAPHRPSSRLSPGGWPSLRPISDARNRRSRPACRWRSTATRRFPTATL
jgi:alkanesulfonate monooxygenase SsuD/methylene tetrahydromethanopterin reductase-like flavin-dependent oxidoreductase (luciferase family)